MNRKQLLGIAVMSFIILSFVLVSYPFLRSLKPSVRAEAAVATFDARNIGIGEFKEIVLHSTFAYRVDESEYVIFKVGWIRELELYYIWDGLNPMTDLVQLY